MVKRPLNNGQGIHFGMNQFLIYNFLQAVNSNFYSRTHRLATIHTSQTGQHSGILSATVSRPTLG